MRFTKLDPAVLLRSVGTVLACLLSVVLSSQSVCAQGETSAPGAALPPPNSFEVVFGIPEEEGFRIVFDPTGAAIKSVNLLRQDATFAAEDGTRDEYLLADIMWANPADRGQGYLSWLWLSEWSDATRMLGDIDLRTAHWDVDRDQPGRVAFGLDVGGGLRIEKIFTYEGGGRRDLKLEFVLRASEQHPLAGQPLVLALRGLAARSPSSEYALGLKPSRAVGQSLSADGEILFASYEPEGEGNPPPLPVVASAADGARIQYAGSTNRFFAALLAATDEASQDAFWTANVLKMPSTAQLDTPAWSVPVLNFGLRFEIPAQGQEKRWTYRYYLGAKSDRVFAENADYAVFDHIIENDLNPGCGCSPPGTRTIAKLLLALLGFFYDLVGNWGVAIMILTVCVRGALVPINFRMQKSMRAYGAKMSVLKPKLDEIQKRYASDKKALQQAMMEFQKENKLFPPLGGCLPMLITIPVFIGLFTALRTSYDLRQQPFCLWIDDLSQPDALFELGLAWVPHFNLLPLIMVALWWWLQRATPLPTDPQQRQMMKIMRYMPLMFGVMLYSYASGLMVYMITSSLFALVEQRVTKRILGPVQAEAGAFSAPTF